MPAVPLFTRFGEAHERNVTQSAWSRVGDERYAFLRTRL